MNGCGSLEDIMSNKKETLFIDCISLPEPLEESQINSYFEQYYVGDLVAREKIIIHNLRFVLYVSNKFKNTMYEQEELFSIGIIGLIKSVDTFNVSKGIKFVTYATRCIDNEILMYMRKEKKYLYDDSIDRILVTDKNGKELKMEDILQDEKSNFVPEIIHQDEMLEIREIVSNLSEFDQEIIKLYFGFYNNVQYKQPEIAAKLHLSQSYVSRRIKKVLEKVKFELRKNGKVIQKKKSK